MEKRVIHLIAATAATAAVLGVWGLFLLQSSTGNGGGAIGVEDSAPTSFERLDDGAVMPPFSRDEIDIALEEGLGIHAATFKSESETDGSSTWEEARVGLRGMCADFGETDYDDFYRMALVWPGQQRGMKAKRMPDLYDTTLNPRGKRLGPLHLEELEGIVSGYNGLLVSMAKDAGDLAKEALLDYFDKGQHERFSADQEPPSTPIASRKGGYTRNSTIRHRGWIVRTRFSSMEYPRLESLLSDIKTLRSERLTETVAYIAGVR